MAATYGGQFDISNVAKYLSTKFNDQVMTGRPLLAKLNGRKKSLDGGYEFREPLRTSTNTTGGWGNPGGYDQLDFTPQGGLEYATFPLKWKHKTVVMSQLEQDQNRGDSAKIDLWEEKIDQCKESFQQEMNSDLYKDGTQDANAIIGLKALVATTGTYAGINRATTGNEFWKANADTTTESLSDEDMLSMYNTSSQNGDSFPDLIVTTRALWEVYHQMLVTNARYEDVEMANLGFKTVTFQGIPVVWDNDCQSGTMYFLNTRKLFWRYLQGWDFNWTVKARMEQQLVDAMVVKWAGQLTTTSCRHQGLLSGKS